MAPCCAAWRGSDDNNNKNNTPPRAPAHTRPETHENSLPTDTIRVHRAPPPPPPSPGDRGGKQGEKQHCARTTQNTRRHAAHGHAQSRSQEKRANAQQQIQRTLHALAHLLDSVAQHSQEIGEHRQAVEVLTGEAGSQRSAPCSSCPRGTPLSAPHHEWPSCRGRCRC